MKCLAVLQRLFNPRVVLQDADRTENIGNPEGEPSRHHHADKPLPSITLPKPFQQAMSDGCFVNETRMRSPRYGLPGHVLGDGPTTIPAR
jgi:hypothetical protein